MEAKAEAKGLSCNEAVNYGKDDTSLLTEIKNADYILHVVDSSSPYLKQQMHVVGQVLASLNAKEIPCLFLLNKWDKTIDPSLQILGYPSLTFSNKTELHVKEVLDRIVSNIGPSTIRAKLLIPYKEGKYTNLLEEIAYIYQKDYQAYGTYYDVEIPMKLYAQFQPFDLDHMVN